MKDSIISDESQFSLRAFLDYSSLLLIEQDANIMNLGRLQNFQIYSGLEVTFNQLSC